MSRFSQLATADTCHKRELIKPTLDLGGLVAEWLACWTQVQKSPGSNRSCDG